jgi:hypothetical protein
MKGKFFARFKGLLFRNRGFYDKGVRHFGIEPKHFSIFRRRRFKDIGIDTFLLQETDITCLVLDYANDPLKGISKTATKG